MHSLKDAGGIRWNVGEQINGHVICRAFGGWIPAGTVFQPRASAGHLSILPADGLLVSTLNLANV